MIPDRLTHSKPFCRSGSGNETAAHVAENGRMTLMFCAFEGDPMIFRVYGKAASHSPARQQ